MKKLYSVTNFSEGINEYSPQGASLIENFNITNDGVLETRRGWTGNNSFSLSELSDEGSSLQIFFANQKLLMQTSNGLYYGVNDTWSAVTNQTGETGSTYTDYFDTRLKVVVADNNRVFLSSTGANLWLDTSETTPALYKWGVSAVQLSVALVASPASFGGVPGTYGTSNGMWITPTVGPSGIGSLKPGWYAFAMAYELKHGGSSPLSIRKLVQLTEGNDTFDLALPNTGSGVDATWAGATDTTDLDGGIDNSVTTVVVTNSAKMLVGMDITVDLGGSSEEVMTITAISVTTEGTPPTEVHRLTVTRGANPFSHSDAETVTFNLLDPQVTGIKIYATDRVSDVSFDELEGTEKQRAMSAPLKHIKTVKSDDTDASQTNIYYQALGLRPLAGQLEGASIPPDSLTNITLYGGRIWGSVGSTDKLVFSALDETAAPLYDLFPSDEMSESSRTYAVIPHVINVRNNITGIGASRDYLAVFSERSIQLVRGQGVISGIYGKQQPGTDLDLSQYLTLMGAKDDWCVAESLGNVYFYSEYDQRVYRIDRDGNVAWISQAIQDLLDSLEVPADSVIHQLVAHEGSVYLVRRSIGDITLLQFDELRDQWTSHNFGSSANMTSFVSNPSAKDGEHGIGLYALRDVDDQVAKVFPRSGAGSTNDNSTEIVPSYTSQEFTFTKPTRLDAVRIGTEDEQEGNVRLDIWVDGVLEASPTGRSLTKNNNFTIRCFQRGYKHKVGFTLTGEQTVRFFELQFRSR